MSRTSSSILSCADGARLGAIAAIALSLLLTACGYRLGDGAAPGESAVPASLSRMSLEGMKRHAPLRLALKSALRARDVQVVAPVRAPVRLVVAGEEILQRSLVIADDAKTREYLLTAVVEFSVKGEDGVLLEKQRVQSEESYLYDAKRPLVSESERERVLRHIRRDLARKIIHRLAAMAAGG